MFPTGNHSFIEKFNAVTNKKLACCMNQTWVAPTLNSHAGAFIKFDCIDNSAANTYSNFKDLWESVDGSTEGKQSNAVALAGIQNTTLTGFYTLDGARCTQFNGFGAITSSKLTLTNGIWTESQVQPLGYATLGVPNVVPTSADEKRRCPILVRAAMIATCPTNPELPILQKTFEYPDANNPLIHVKRCSAAASIQIHVRIEQVTEIAGSPVMTPVDTFVEQRLASSISIDKIISNKSGSACPPGTYKQGEICSY